MGQTISQRAHLSCFFHRASAACPICPFHLLRPWPIPSISPKASTTDYSVLWIRKDARICKWSAYNELHIKSIILVATCKATEHAVHSKSSIYLTWPEMKSYHTCRVQHVTGFWFIDALLSSTKIRLRFIAEPIYPKSVFVSRTGKRILVRT